MYQTNGSRHQGGRIRTGDLLLPMQADSQAFPRPERKPIADRNSVHASLQSAQRESNPHIRHGEAVGYRYIMGTFADPELSNNRGHRVGLEPTSPHYGCALPRRWTTSAFSQSVGPEGLEPSPTWLRARHAAANTLIPFRFSLLLRAQSARRESNPRPGPYKRPALTTELRASGAEGSRTLTIPLKRRKRYRYATTPCVG